MSTEVDAHLSFDTRAMVDKALRLADLYESKGINVKERVYIKIVRRLSLSSRILGAALVGEQGDRRQKSVSAYLPSPKSLGGTSV